MLIVLAAALILVSDTPDPPEFAAYRQCVADSAAEFEPSGEAADVVVDAAIADCLKFRSEIFEKNGPFTEQTRQLEDEIVAAFETQIRDETLASIVRQRAARRRTHP